MKRSVNNSDIPSEIIRLVNSAGINSPLISEVLRIAARHLIMSLPDSDIEKYASAIQMARKVGKALRRILQEILHMCGDEDRVRVTLLFITFMLTSLLQQSGDDSE